jgi:pyrroloquinoline quinone biosynthesis protein D
LTITAATIPQLRRGVRRQFDTTRNAAILMAPERVIMLDDIADAILSECDGAATVGDIVARLAARFEAPETEVQPDVLAFFEDLIEKGLIRC